MAKIRIDGEYYEFDRNHKPMAEMLALEKEVGTTYGQWEDGLNNGSAEALAGLIWLVWKRAGREKPLTEILASDINLGDLAIEDDDPPGPTVPASHAGSLEYDRRKYLAAFCQLGIRPWEIGLLSLDEFEALIDFLEETKGG